jgi:hypothetical protein
MCRLKKRIDVWDPNLDDNYISLTCQAQKAMSVNEKGMVEAKYGSLLNVR